MNRTFFAVFVVTALSLAACTSYPLPKVTYDKAVPATTTKTGQISLTSGKIGGSNAPVTVPVSGAFITVPGSTSPNWANFNTEDQALFVGYLTEELRRLNILMPAQAGPADMALDVQFVSTLKAPNNDITLNVTLTITTANGSSSKNYMVRAFEGGDYWTRINTTLSTGKKMAAQKLMDAIIPDIQAAAATLNQAN